MIFITESWRSLQKTPFIQQYTALDTLANVLLTRSMWIQFAFDVHWVNVNSIRIQTGSKVKRPLQRGTCRDISRLSLILHHPLCTVDQQSQLPLMKRLGLLPYGTWVTVEARVQSRGALHDIYKYDTCGSLISLNSFPSISRILLMFLLNVTPLWRTFLCAFWTTSKVRWWLLCRSMGCIVE